MAELKQNTARVRMFKMIDSADHFSKKTGLTCTVNLSKNGGAFGAAGGAVAEVANGWYSVSLTTTDTNTLGDLAYYITATGADDTDFCDSVTAQILGDTLTANTTQLAGQTVTAAAGVTFPSSVASPTNITAATGIVLSGVTHTGAVIPTVTTVTNQLTAAQIATGVWQDATAGDFTTASSIGKSLYTSGAVPGAANGLFIAGSNAATTVNFTGNLSGSVGSVTGAVGSVTGAVGSVTGNVGGNVTGSVGSVVGAVGSVTGAVGSVTGNVGGNVVGSVASVTSAVAITSNIKQNQALAAFEFLMTDSTNHAPSTGLVVSVTRSIDGGVFAAGTLSAVTEVGSGLYKVDFGAGDLNGKVIVLKATAAASDTTIERIITQV